MPDMTCYTSYTDGAAAAAYAPIGFNRVTASFGCENKFFPPNLAQDNAIDTQKAGRLSGEIGHLAQRVVYES